jgi:dolichol kinase
MTALADRCFALFRHGLALAGPLLHSKIGVNALGIVWCSLFALATLAFGVLLRRGLRLPLWATRDVMRSVFALWLVIAFRWIDLWPASWVATGFFVYLNMRAAKHRWTKSLMNADDPDDLPLGNAWALLTLAFLYWWPGYQFMVMAGVVAMWIGASAADVVGRLWGRNRFRFRTGRGQTFESIAAMALVSAATIFVAAFFCAEIPDVWFVGWAVIAAILNAAVATCCLLYTPRPYEVWTIPLLTSTMMYFYAKVGFHF